MVLAECSGVPTERQTWSVNSHSSGRNLIYNYTEGRNPDMVTIKVSDIGNVYLGKPDVFSENDLWANIW